MALTLTICIFVMLTTGKFFIDIFGNGKIALEHPYLWWLAVIFYFSAFALFEVIFIRGLEYLQWLK